jgi:3-oxoacyl-[acyl-carrier protein] reductase
MDLGLKGRVAFVAAAGRGLGRATAEELAAEGARIVCCARSEAILAVAAEIAAAHGAETLGIVADVSVPADVERAVNAAIARFGPVGRRRVRSRATRPRCGGRRSRPTSTAS